MTLRDLLKEKNMTMYRLSKVSGVPYATCNDLVNGKAKMEKCSAITLYEIANALGVTMEQVLLPNLEKEVDLHPFKQTICRRLREKGDMGFLFDLFDNDDIWKYYERSQLPECLYLLGMVDYISRVNDIPLKDEYDTLRKLSLDSPVYLSEDLKEGKSSAKKPISEWKRFQILENNPRGEA